MTALTNGTWKVQTKGYSHHQAKKLFAGKLLVFVGDSVVRTMYKDLVAFIENGQLLSHKEAKCKGENSFRGDELIEGGVKDGLFNGSSYIEVREYRTEVYCIRFYFITRAYYDYSETILMDFLSQPVPDVVYLNSCLWDLTRWKDEVKSGENTLCQYKANLEILFTRLHEVLPQHSVVLWGCCMPIGDSIKGGVMDGAERNGSNSLRRDVLEANYFSSALATKHDIDVIDFHYFFRAFQIARKADGTHWNSSAHRNMTFMLMHHLSRCWGVMDMVAKPEYAVWVEAEVDHQNISWLSSSQCNIPSNYSGNQNWQHNMNLPDSQNWQHNMNPFDNQNWQHMNPFDNQNWQHMNLPNSQNWQHNMNPFNNHNWHNMNPFNNHNWHNMNPPDTRNWQHNMNPFDNQNWQHNMNPFYNQNWHNMDPFKSQNWQMNPFSNSNWQHINSSDNQNWQHNMNPSGRQQTNSFGGQHRHEVRNRSGGNCSLKMKNRKHCRVERKANPYHSGGDENQNCRKNRMPSHSKNLNNREPHQRRNPLAPINLNAQLHDYNGMRFF